MSSLCGACYLYEHGKGCSEYGEGYEFDDSLDCRLFSLSSEAKEILLKHKKELV